MFCSCFSFRKKKLLCLMDLSWCECCSIFLLNFVCFLRNTDDSAPEATKRKASKVEVVSASALSCSTVQQPNEPTENDQFRAYR